MSQKRIPRCSFAAGRPNQCTGVARWVTMNAPGNPTRMIWCNECHGQLLKGDKHQKLTPKLAAMMDRPWNWFPTPDAAMHSHPTAAKPDEENQL
jgi:hypothetical protein